MPSKRIIEAENGGAKSCILASSLDQRISSTIQKLLVRLQNERDRLMDEAKAQVETMTDDERNYCEVKFNPDMHFEDALNTLLTVPFANLTPLGHRDKIRKKEDIKLSPKLDMKNMVKCEPSGMDTPSPSIVSSEVGEPSVCESKPAIVQIPSATPASYLFSADMYKDMRFVYKLSGKDLLGNLIEKPYGIIHLPGSECLAFIHNENCISIVSSDAEIVATFKMRVRNRPHIEYLMRQWDMGGLAADGRTNELYFLDTYSRISKIKPAEAKSRAETIFPEIVKSTAVLMGLAISQKTRTLYSSFCSQEIIGYSTRDWSAPPVATFHSKKGEGSPTICACSDTHLYYKMVDERELYRVEIKENGSLASHATKFCDGFKKIRGVSVDPSGNVLIVDNGRRRVEVLSDKGQSLGSIYPISPYKESFYPSGVAVLEQSTLSKNLPMVAVTDYYADCILFFAPQTS